jgi:small subunit ribosomal protein S20
LANIKSQIKRNRQNDKRRLTNRVYRGEARIAVKNARTAIDDSAPETKEELKKAISALDKAVEKGVIHKNNAARRKSRLMKAFTAMKPAEVKTPVEEPKPEAEVKEEPKPRRAVRTKTVKTAEPAAEVKTKAKTTSTKVAASKTKPKAKPKITTTKKAAAK